MFVVLPTLLLLLLLPPAAEADWVDPDTPHKYLTTVPLTESDERDYELVSWVMDFFCLLVLHCK
jgi:hypothetical protein